ncbi:tRNA epoxyqueuosine(34) reductase QueG [Symmachiella dynata]|uniref:tRNA epoxyqueuosine(34) reductase QueG n=1 Tax=Symmachiella dynata TaxID=2527995 RepID=UPI0030EDBA17
MPTAAIKQHARDVGFDLVGIAPAVRPAGFGDFQAWLQKCYDGEMRYLRGREEAYAHPEYVLPHVQSVIMLGLNYRTEEPVAPPPTGGRISRYAWGDVDYHDTIRGKLRQLAGHVHEQLPGCRTRGVVDTAPLLERDFARLAGLGWSAKNTMLINKQIGSWTFLAALLIDRELDYDAPHETSHCGSCTRCLDACPTDAFAEPFVLDASRCISYLTIELRGPIPTELREPMGDWLFGCDICQEVCPWNRKAPISGEPTFQPRDDMRPVDALELLTLSEAEFRERFRHTPLFRPGRAGLLRNAAIVLGNARDERAVPALIAVLNDDEPLIRGAVAWALGRIGGVAARGALHEREAVETDDDVVLEILAALVDCALPPGKAGG